jgi:uncharacterized protein (TIGR02466 family)
MSRTLHLLFSTPVGISNCNFDNSNSCILNEDYELNQDGIQISKDKFILDKYQDLKSWILEEVHAYAVSSMACEKKLKITQSWSVKSNSDLQFHQHPNSIISGAYYVSADNNSSDLRFLKPYVNGQIKWETNSNLYKDQDWMWDYVSFESETGKLILFPSYLNHGVVSNSIHNNKRCVLSFNTWFVNSIGSIDKLTFLN